MTPHIIILKQTTTIKTIICKLCYRNIDNALAFSISRRSLWTSWLTYLRSYDLTISTEPWLELLSGTRNTFSESFFPSKRFMTGREVVFSEWASNQSLLEALVSHLNVRLQLSKYINIVFTIESILFKAWNQTLRNAFLYLAQK